MEGLQFVSWIWYAVAAVAAAGGGVVLAEQLLRARNRGLLKSALAGQPVRSLTGGKARGQMQVEAAGLTGEVTWAKTAYSLGYSGAGWVRVQFPWVPPEPVIVSLERDEGGAAFFASAAVVPLGEPGFDARFTVQGHTPAYVRALLIADARRCLGEIAALHPALPHREPPLLDAGAGGFTLRFHANLANEPERMAKFLARAVALFEAIHAAAGSAAACLPKSGAAARCPVCGDPLREPLRRCAGCGTPHHGECWSYFGGCAIYACRSRGGRAGRPPGAGRGGGAGEGKPGQP